MPKKRRWILQSIFKESFGTSKIMSKKTAKGLFQVGVNARNICHDWDGILHYMKNNGLIDKYQLHEADLEIMREGFEVVVRSPACPTPESRFPFKINKESLAYAEVPPNYFRWFWQQEWKKQYPQVIRYMKEYKWWIRKKEMDSRQFDSETQSLIDSLTDL